MKRYWQFLMIQKKMEELNRPIYFYPLIYDIRKRNKNIKINQEKPTVIFFKDGKEANHLTIEKKEQSSKVRLRNDSRIEPTSVSKYQKLEDEMAKSESASTKITEDQTNTTTRSTDDN